MSPYIYMNWSLGGVRGPKAGSVLQQVCVHEVGNRGLAVGIIYIYIYFFFFVWVPGLCLYGREPLRVCLDAPLTPQAPITRSRYEETPSIASAHPAMETGAGTAGARLRAAPAVAAIAEVQA